MRVEWDEDKNLSNQEKHRVLFDEAKELFLSGADYLEMTFIIPTTKSASLR